MKAGSVRSDKKLKKQLSYDVIRLISGTFRVRIILNIELT